MFNITREIPLYGGNGAGAPAEETEQYRDPEALLTHEWIVTNGLGGFASSSIACVTTRKYHGLLVAALPVPFGRMVMLNHLSERIYLPDGQRLTLGCEERSGGTLNLDGIRYMTEFRLEEGLPVWHFDIHGIILEKRVQMVHMQNTVHLSYRLLHGDGAIRLKLQPSVHFRHHEAPVNTPITDPYIVTAIESSFEISNRVTPPLRLLLRGERSRFTLEEKRIQNIFFRIESHRGYESIGDLWTPGYFAVDLSRDNDATLVASTESWESIRAVEPSFARSAERERRRMLLNIAPAKAREGMGAELILAADQFIITPAGRAEDAARARASGDEVRTVIAGYHWFTDWGRDTMISLEGLTLNTGRFNEAGWILRTFAHYIRDGLIPNMFPEGKHEGLYHTADATLWFFHAIERYTAVTGDRETLRLILPRLHNIVQHHLAGTRFGIRVDPADGLLMQGAEGYQLTWMDAKVGDWVVTPRRGKAVEVNALWYNALRLLQRWSQEEMSLEKSRELASHADRAYESFNKRFWYGDGGYLYDVVDGEQGDDTACRPNQVFAISLDHPVLDPSRWQPVMQVVEERLLTPLGLRSLAPGHPDYKSRYYGDLRARDAAYHQGTVWGWLIGPFIDAWLKLHPGDNDGARQFLKGFERHLSEGGIGSISEVFDAVEPFTPRGCIAQAWSVAEVLRAWMKTAPRDGESGVPAGVAEQEGEGNVAK